MKPTKEPAKYKQLATGDPYFVGIIYAAKEGTGGVVVGGKDACVPTVFRLEWSHNVQDLVCTKDNPNGPITNLDLEMVGVFLCWLIMGELAPCPHHKYVGLYCDNSPTVSWVLRMVTRLLKISTYVGPGSDTDTDGLGLILGLHYYEVPAYTDHN